MVRKRVNLETTIRSKTASIDILNIEDMACFNKIGGQFEFKRLRYRGVPTTIATGKRKGEFKATELTLANRDDFIRSVYKIKPDSPCSTFHSHIKVGLVSYLRYIDEFSPQSSPFSLDEMNRCIKHFNQLTLQGITTSRASRVHAALSIILKGFGRSHDAEKLALVPHYQASGKQCAYDIETELKPVSRLLIKGYLELIEHIKNDTHPEVHPFFDEHLFNNMVEKFGWNNINIKKNAFKHAMLINNAIKSQKDFSDRVLQRQILFNQTSRCALYLFFMWTGMNDSVLKKMKRNDVSFKCVGSDVYVFEGVKGRANYKSIDHSLGFSKYAKNLIAEWLEVSKAHFILAGIKDIEDQPFIPFVDSNLKIKDFSDHGTGSDRINKLIEKLFPFRINSSRFRKTKSDILMRVTEDMYLVSQGLNNTINVVASTYSSGVKADHERHLSATFESLALISKGNSIKDSVNDAKVLHSDILTDYDYKQRLTRNEIKIPTITPHGIRCSGDESKKGAIERKYKNLAIEFKEDEKKCTDFLSCFDCENHILIASESDIWLMLSFFEQVLELKSIPSQNSIPKEKLYQLEVILSRTLDRFRHKAPKEYAGAELKMAHSDHPLFMGLQGLNDTLQVFNV
ncbi:hypothetical protein ACRWQN_12675 [Shewanella sp. HL-SH8]|uniref:hypothetical protein n=1 Tax=Shewanella sp. HL-SH8 TaxID=3436242 RepID=UPI003EBF7FE5